MINAQIPLVSILCITFNHEDYIAEAIEGFLNQKTTFFYEIIIHDDASTDRTTEIIKDYQSRYPDLIKAIVQKENLYSKKDGSLEKAFFSACTGKYIAFCEGDDFWVNTDKLQKQVDFLEANTDYGLIHHDANYFFQKEGKVYKDHHKTNRIEVNNGFVYADLLRSNNIYSPTVVFRSNLLKHFNDIDPDTRNKFMMGDYVMWLEFSNHCKFYYMPLSMATYRVLENSASRATLYEKSLNFVDSYCDIKLFFLKRYPISSVTIDDIEKDRISLKISTAIKFKKNKEARSFASEMKMESFRDLLKRFIVLFPGVFRFIQIKNKQ